MRIESGILTKTTGDSVPYGGLDTMPEEAVSFAIDYDTSNDYWKINFYNEEGNKIGRMYLVKN